MTKTTKKKTMKSPNTSTTPSVTPSKETLETTEDSLFEDDLGSHEQIMEDDLDAGLHKDDESGDLEGTSTNIMIEPSGSLKNFRHHPDMENFYRFIHENDLRLEALTILDEILAERKAKSK